LRLLSFNFKYFEFFSPLSLSLLIIVKMAARIIWNDPETDLLVSERRRRNVEYHLRFRGNKTEFWESVA
jgi:hypothetical protein